MHFVNSFLLRIGIYLYYQIKKGTPPRAQGKKDMTKAERKAIDARTKDLIKAGVEKELAKVMAKVELETGLIKVVVNYN